MTESLSLLESRILQELQETLSCRPIEINLRRLPPKTSTLRPKAAEHISRLITTVSLVTKQPSSPTCLFR